MVLEWHIGRFPPTHHCKVTKQHAKKVLPSSQTYSYIFMPYIVEPLLTPTTSKQFFSNFHKQLFMNFLVQKNRLSFWLHIRATTHCYFASCMKTDVSRTSFLSNIPCRKGLHQLLAEYDTTGTDRAAASDSRHFQIPVANMLHVSNTNGGLIKTKKVNTETSGLTSSQFCCYPKGSCCFCTVARRTKEMSLRKAFWHRSRLSWLWS